MTSSDVLPKIACKGLWKLFGRDPAGFLARHGNLPSAADIEREGYVGACCDVSLSAASGEILVVMGLSGSGKSTLVRCLSRLIEPDAGTIHFDDEDITKANEERLIELRRRRMGMVFQNFGLLPHRTALRNVSFPLEIHGVPVDQSLARARQMLSLVGLAGREDNFPRELSGGQQQRVGIARSLAGDPELWLLDEPFSALDPLIRREMQDEFLRLQTMLKKTIVFITHDFDEAVRLASRIGIMRNGSLVQLATPEEIVVSPANDYVREFAKTAPRNRLISVGRVMLPLETAMPEGQPIGVGAKLDQAAPRVLGSEAPVLVVDQSGAPAGLMTRQRMIEALFPSDGAA